ncbi:MAG: MBL fold metallo-hydrolase [Lachnospiraceae bacterium]|nr:MBL fold metallo-hydrolase [Lachnospiraceae bacterium]
MVTRLKYGNTNTFFIRGTAGNLLVDTDYAGTLPLFYKEIKRQNISLKDIAYVLATHYHPDHMGLVSELMKQGVKLLLVDVQREYVGFSDEIFAREPRLGYEPICVEGATVISCEESRAFLRRLGIEGEIISTPRHSKDSVSLILDDGTCIVGDLEPMEYLGAYEENEKLKKDWERILSRKPKRIYYAHANEKVFEM